VYFVPHVREGVPPPDYGNHGEVLRYDTTDNFQSGNAWSTFDPGANGVGNDPDGYVMGVFDGRYIYFAPYHNGNEHHGEVLRYDITFNFESAESWSTFDPGANGVGNDPDGYWGVELVGKYIYFAPYHNGNEYHSEVLRYDTTSEFRSAESWSTFDAGANGVGNDPVGYRGEISDGRYLYFTPLYNGSFSHGEVLRYDTTSNFESPNAWSTFDAGANGVGNDPVGHAGGIFERYKIDVLSIKDSSSMANRIISYTVCTSIKCAPCVWRFKVGCCVIAQNLAMIETSII
jgi:hypothetical protein